MQAQHGVALVRLREQAMFDLVTAARTRASASGRMPPAWLDRSSTPRIRPWLSHTGTAAQVRMRLGSK